MSSDVAVAALEHLLDEVHTPELVEMNGASVLVCAECGHTTDGDEVVFRPWPCPTVQAATDALAPSAVVGRSERVAGAVGKGIGIALIAVGCVVLVGVVALVAKVAFVGARALWGLV